MSRFLTSREVLAIHDQVIQRWGGSHGARDVRLLESALGAPQQTFGGRFLHPDAFAQAATLLRSLALNHPFVDGNKRTAFMSAEVFLELNGWRLEVPTGDAVDFLVRVAAGKPSLDDIQDWLRVRCQMGHPGALSCAGPSGGRRRPPTARWPRPGATPRR